MPRNSAPRRGARFGIPAALGVALLAALLTAPVVSAGDAAPITLASASPGRTLLLGDVAADGDLLGVVFQKQNRSYLRWSTNDGQSFTSKVALRSGLAAQNPRVAVCDDLIFSVWQTAAAGSVGVDYRNVVTGEKGKYLLGPGVKPDVACYGEVVAVTWWHDDHAWLAVHQGRCAGPCSPAVKMDLGTADFDSPPRITAHADGFTAAWITTGLAVQRFDYSPGGGGSFTIDAGPVLTLMAGTDVRLPSIAGLGSRVAIAYARAGQTHLRLSDDMGSSFGPRIIVSEFCRNCPEGGSQPDSVAVRGSDLVVEVIRGGGVPTAYEMVAFVSRNSGDTWDERSSHGGGFQRAALLEGASFAEVWDAHFYNGFPYPETQQAIGFQVLSL